MLVLAGCTIDRGSQEEAAAASSEKKLPPVASVDNGETDVNPAEPITVKALSGTLSDVTMSNQDGKVVESKLSADKKSWTTDEPLGFYRTYTIVAHDTEGGTSTIEFSTTEPAAVADAYLSPLADSTVGIGQVISIHFTQSIVDRKAAQDTVSITTNPPVEGAFYWLNNQELRWRPKDFWTPGTTVDVDVKAYGANLGGGIYGDGNNHTNFTIGDAVIATADDNTKQITVTRNGEVIKTMPTSMGSAKFPTPNGTYVVGDRNADLIMDSSTYGLAIDAPDGYRTDVKFATQMSWSGIYVHAAPWSVWAQGSQNTSHGCLNVSTENAQWFFNNMKRGDPVIVKNTIGGTLSGYDGLGDWNIPWTEWSAGNADD
nr:Ig-like domain-containing protein [Corynebacterium argentoratense]